MYLLEGPLGQKSYIQETFFAVPHFHQSPIALVENSSILN